MQQLSSSYSGESQPFSTQALQQIKILFRAKDGEFNSISQQLSSRFLNNFTLLNLYDIIVRLTKPECGGPLITQEVLLSLAFQAQRWSFVAQPFNLIDSQYFLMDDQPLLQFSPDENRQVVVEQWDLDMCISSQDEESINIFGACIETSSSLRLRCPNQEIALLLLSNILSRLPKPKSRYSYLWFRTPLLIKGKQGYSWFLIKLSFVDNDLGPHYDVQLQECVSSKEESGLRSQNRNLENYNGLSRTLSSGSTQSRPVQRLPSLGASNYFDSMRNRNLSN